MDKARAVVDRLLAQGVSVEQTARKAGVTVMTVNRWRGAQNSHNIPISKGSPDGSKVISHNISWGDALDEAWDTRRRIGGRERYRVMLRAFAASFAELGDPYTAGIPKVTRANRARREVTFYCDDGSRRRLAVPC